MKRKLFIIGLGERGEVHTQLLSPRPDIIITGGYDPICSKEQKAFPIYNNLELGLKATQPDSILIATPPKVRFELFTAFEHIPSIKTIILEKPLALTLSEAHKMAEKCLEKHWDLFVVHQSRFCPEFIALKQALTENRLGKLQFIKAACHGNLFNQGSHMIDLIRWLTNEEKIIWIDATGTNNRQKLCELTQIPNDYKPDDEHPGHLWSSLTMRLESGIEVFLTCGLLDAQPLPQLGPWLQRRITLVGSEGLAHAHLSAYFEEISAAESHKKYLSTSPKNYLDSLKLFYDYLFSLDRQSHSEREQSINNHLHTLAVLQAGFTSAQQNEVINLANADWTFTQHPNSLLEHADQRPIQSSPLISVIIPMETHRGIADQAVRSWAINQQCEKKLYEVIVIFYNNQHELKEQIISKYGDRIRIASIDAQNEIELCHHGATLAQGEYLLFTESHCVAEPTAVKQAINFFKIEPHAGFYPRTTAIEGNAVSQLEFKLYNLWVDQFENPECWAKITLHAFGIKKQIYFNVGGLAYQYNRFAYWLFGVDFHRKGYTLGYAPGVGVAHLFVNGFKPLDHFNQECLSGEVLFRLEEHQQFNYLNYFGLPAEWIHLQKYNPELSKIMLGIFFRMISSKQFGYKKSALMINTFGATAFNAVGKAFYWYRYNLPRLFYKFRVYFSVKEALRDRLHPVQ